MIAIAGGLLVLFTLATVAVGSADADAEEIFLMYAVLALLASVGAVPVLQWMQEDRYRGLIEKGLGRPRKSPWAWVRQRRKQCMLGALAAVLSVTCLAYFKQRAAVPSVQPLMATDASAAGAPHDVQQRARIDAAVHAWADAWGRSRIDDYLAMYGPSFKPADGMSRETWERVRRKRMAAAGPISLEVADLAVTPIGPAEAKVQFVQAYSARQVRERSRKTLMLALAHGQWKIVSEHSVPMATGENRVDRP